MMRGCLPTQSRSRSLASDVSATHAMQAVIETDTETRMLVVEDSPDIVTSSVAELRFDSIRDAAAAAALVLRLHAD